MSLFPLDVAPIGGPGCLQHAITTNEPAPTKEGGQVVASHSGRLSPPSVRRPSPFTKRTRCICAWAQDLSVGGSPEDFSVRAAEGHACRDKFLIGNQLLDSEVQVGEGCAKENHGPFQRLRPREHFGRGCMAHEGPGYPCLDQRTACSL